MLEKVDLRKLKPNPFRDVSVDPIDPVIVTMLAKSIKDFGFKSGGIVCRRADDGIEIGSGHHRVEAALKAGITHGVVEIDKMDDAQMARWLAQENATQRGQSSTAGPGSVMGAIMYLAPIIMRGEFAKLPPRLENRAHGFVSTPRDERDLGELQKRITSDDGLGEVIICDFLHDVPGFTRASTRHYLEIVKATGAYSRLIKRIASAIAEQHAEEERKAKAAAEAAEREAKEAEKRREEAEKAKASAKEKEDRERAERDRKKAEAERKAAEEKQKRAEAAHQKTAAVTAKKASAAATKHMPTLAHKVAAQFKNPHQVKVFFEVVKTIGVDVLPIEQHVPLAKRLWEIAERDKREMSGTFIRETIHELVFRAKTAARREQEAERKAALARNVILQAKEMAHCMDRDLVRVGAQGRKLAALLADNPEVEFAFTEATITHFKDAVRFLNGFIKLAEARAYGGGNNVTNFPRLTAS